MYVFVYIWGLLFLAVAILLTVLSVRFLMHARKANKLAQEYVKKVEIQTKKEYNKIASLSPEDLGNFLTNVFARMLVIESEVGVSEKDTEGIERLYARAQAATIRYLGEETVGAIEYYYGENYITRWCDHAYRMLIMTDTLSDILNKKASVEGVKKHM